MRIELTSAVHTGLLAEAARCWPHEACGLLLGDDIEVISQMEICANVHPHPATHFEIDPASLIAAHRRARLGGVKLIGYYHSHPDGDAVPSSVDRAMASGDGRIWAIIGRGKVVLWRDALHGFEPVSHMLRDD